MTATVLLAAILIVGVYAVIAPRSPSAEVGLEGSLFVSDAGQSHGGFEYTASYNASVHVSNGHGLMNLTLFIGLGDTLTKHEFGITDFQMTSGGVSMKIDGQEVQMPWTANDTVWNHSFDDHYIASWGSDAPASELRGTISPLIFPGLPGTYYVELRLAQTASS